MEAFRRRRIRPGREYDKLFPVSTKQDTVVKGEGKAKLHHTINLIKSLVEETKNDTRVIAPIFKGKDLEETCRKIWDFVYQHIQYKKDQAGVEQVRRPSRTWADRYEGVDCDCYTVFISSILSNLKIPHKVRITKYGGKSHFQHIYPVVPKNGNIRQELNNASNDYFTIDCVADFPNYEVPFSEFRDFVMGDNLLSGEINGFELGDVSGVDLADLMSYDLGFLTQEPESQIKQRLTLRQIISKPRIISSAHNRPKEPAPANNLTSRILKAEQEYPERVTVSNQTLVPEPQQKAEYLAPLRTAPNEAYIQTVIPDHTQWDKSIHLVAFTLVLAGLGYGTYKIAEKLTN
jgi:hypothetical protein